MFLSSFGWTRVVCTSWPSTSTAYRFVAGLRPAKAAYRHAGLHRLTDQLPAAQDKMLERIQGLNVIGVEWLYHTAHIVLIPIRVDFHSMLLPLSAD